MNTNDSRFGHFVTNVVHGPAVEVDCSSWDTLGEAITYGTFETNVVQGPSIETVILSQATSIGAEIANGKNPIAQKGGPSTEKENRSTKGLRLYSCDLCGKTLDPGTEPVFRWTLAGRLMEQANSESGDTTILEEDDLVSSNATPSKPDSDGTDDRDTEEMLPLNVRRSYDLCSKCYSKLILDPLGTGARTSRQFQLDRTTAPN
jgi:hypothetical protein